MQVHWIHAEDQMVFSSDATIELDESLNSVIDGYLKYNIEKTINQFTQLVTYTLVVRRLQPTDAGTYTCQVNMIGGPSKIS